MRKNARSHCYVYSGRIGSRWCHADCNARSLLCDSCREMQAIRCLSSQIRSALETRLLNYGDGLALVLTFKYPLDYIPMCIDSKIVQ